MARLIDAIIEAMDRTGIDGSILVWPWGPYRDDPSYAAAAYRAHPDRLRLVAPFDVRVPDLEEKFDRWVATPGAVGLRLLGWEEHDISPSRPAVRLVARAAARAGLPLCVQSWGRLDIPAELARLHLDTLIVLDHLGLAQPLRPPPPPDPFAELPEVLALADRDNVAVKVTAACTMSHRPFPFDDLWEPVGAIVDAFGVDRCMWGTDWTRTQEAVGLEDAVAVFRDHWPGSAPERAALMGGTAAALFGWDPPPSP